MHVANNEVSEEVDTTRRDLSVRVNEEVPAPRFHADGRMAVRVDNHHAAHLYGIHEARPIFLDAIEEMDVTGMCHHGQFDLCMRLFGGNERFDVAANDRQIDIPVGARRLFIGLDGHTEDIQTCLCQAIKTPAFKERSVRVQNRPQTLGGDEIDHVADLGMRERFTHAYDSHRFNRLGKAFDHLYEEVPRHQVWTHGSEAAFERIPAIGAVEIAAENRLEHKRKESGYARAAQIVVGNIAGKQGKVSGPLDLLVDPIGIPAASQKDMGTQSVNPP